MAKLRLAWFTPVASDQSEVASYSAALLPRLVVDYDIDVFVDLPLGAHGPIPAAPHSPHSTYSLFNAYDFVWKHRRQPYDLPVYQLGSDPCHDYMWAYLARYPGLIVLHDAELHHARARSLIQQKRADDYRAEFRYNHPEAKPEIAEFFVEALWPESHPELAQFDVTTRSDSAFYRFWPMRRTVLESARLAAVHNSRVAGDLGEQCPSARIELIRIGVPERTSDAGARARVRRLHGIPDEMPVFSVFGPLTPERRIAQTLDAFAAVTAARPTARLFLGGHMSPELDVTSEILGRNLTELVTVVVPDETGALEDYVAATDVGISLRWPASGRVSWSWLQCLAAGKATIITELTHTVDAPTLDPRSRTPALVGTELTSTRTRANPGTAIAVGISLLDEARSLHFAMRRLADDPGFRDQLGRQGRDFWRRHHTFDQMLEDYRQIIATAMTRPVRVAASLPEHLTRDGSEEARRVLEGFGLGIDLWYGTRGVTQQEDAPGNDDPAER